MKSLARLICADVRAGLGGLPEASVQCVVTSPPYWGLRDYGVPPSVWGGKFDCAHDWGDELRVHKGGPHGDGVMLKGSRAVIEAQAKAKNASAGRFCMSCGAWLGCLGLEPTYPLYVEHMTEVFADVHRVLKPDGVLWLNLGDCYATGAGAVGDHPGGGAQGARWAGSVSPTRGDGRPDLNGAGKATSRKSPRSGHEGKHDYIDPGIGPLTQPNRLPQPGLKPKDLVGIPWRVAFALQDDGWWLRSDVIWSKPNPMPESVRDRPTKAHEYVFLLTKREKYFYDAKAIAEAATGDHPRNVLGPVESAVPGASPHRGMRRSGNKARVIGAERGRPGSALGSGIPWEGTTRNKRSVWHIGTQAFPEAHFAVMPEAVVEPCILAGSREGDTVLDPFAGSATVGVVALRKGRPFIGIEINPEYVQMGKRRIQDDAPLLNTAEVA